MARYHERFMANSVRAVIFDYGNVLCEPQQPQDLETLAGLLHMPPEQLRDGYWRYRAAYDRAELDSKEYWTKVAGAAPSDGVLAKLVEVDTNSWLHPRRATLAWVDQVRGNGLRTALLSNLPTPLCDALENGCSWMPRFDVRTYSCNVGSTKPDRAIYDHCVRELGVRPEEAAFLDDRPENIEGAARLGIRALLFESASGAADELARMGIPVA